MSSSPHDRSESAAGARRLAAHAEECEQCLASPPPLDRIAALLDASASRLDPAPLSALTLRRVRPELERLARMTLWRRIAASVLLALLPLPVVLLSDAYLLRLLYDLMRAVLPAAVALYVVASYTAALSLLFAATYAAIPILMTRTGGSQPSVAA